MRTRLEFGAAISLLAAIALAGCRRETTAPATSLESVPAFTLRNSVGGVPPGWYGYLGQPSVFTVGVEAVATHGGGHALFLANAGPAPDSTYATISQFLRPDLYAGHRLRLSGWLRPSGVELTYGNYSAGKAPGVSGLWMRIDGIGAQLAFDNMEKRPLTGTADWQFVSVVLDVPANAIDIAFGVLFSGSGQLLADNLALDTVSTSTPTTNTLVAPVATPALTPEVATLYRTLPAAPSNLTFETVVHGSASSRRSPQGLLIGLRQ